MEEKAEALKQGVEIAEAAIATALNKVPGLFTVGVTVLGVSAIWGYVLLQLGGQCLGQ